MAKKEQVVIRLIASHPTGARRRCGFVFGTKPTLVEVTKEEMEIINADECLVVVDKGLALEDGLANPLAKTGEETPETDEEGEQDGDSDSDDEDEDEETETSDDEDSEDDEDDSETDEEDEDEEPLTLEGLMEFKKDELEALAKEAGITLAGDPKKEEIANLILTNSQQ